MAITMSEQDDDFLKRWSRRKQAAAVDAKRVKEEPAPQPAPDEARPKAEDAFDPATLPSLDSITAISDVRNFLRAGVPAELTRAALRRAWSADPAIRDFIGLSENAWDFTAPDAIPGFGPLNASPEEIKALVDRIISSTTDLAEAASPPTGEAVPASDKSAAQPGVRQSSDPPESAAGAAPQALPEPAPESQRVDVAMQQQPSDDDGDRPRPRRSRGAALPR